MPDSNPVMRSNETNTFPQVSVAPLLLSHGLSTSPDVIDRTLPSATTRDALAAVDGDTNTTTNSVIGGLLAPSPSRAAHHNLQTLPLTIRQKVFQKLLVHEPRPILLLPFRTHRLHAQILRVCKSFYIDGAPIFYSCNVFRISFSRSTSPRRRLDIWLPHTPDWGVMEMLEYWRDSQDPHPTLSPHGDVVLPAKYLIKKASLGMIPSRNWADMLEALIARDLALEEIYLEFKHWGKILQSGGRRCTEKYWRQEIECALDVRDEYDDLVRVLNELTIEHGVRIWAVLSGLDGKESASRKQTQGSSTLASNLDDRVIEATPVDDHYYCWEVYVDNNYDQPVISLERMEECQLPEPVERMAAASRP